jgi:cysteine-rich repeat protein
MTRSKISLLAGLLIGMFACKADSLNMGKNSPDSGDGSFSTGGTGGIHDSGGDTGSPGLGGDTGSPGLGGDTGSPGLGGVSGPAGAGGSGGSAGGYGGVPSGGILGQSGGAGGTVTTGKVSKCGDGVIDPGEQCDDGNMVSGDGCSALCQVEARATGGATVTSTGGASVTPTGGTTGIATGGAGGAVSCTTVVCPSIPSSCKKIVQDSSACCPVCTDTGCDPCPDLACASGTHSETAVGACCPTCVADPPDACTQGQQSYAVIRISMLTKYSSSVCQNSSECVLVSENNLCVWNCDISLLSTTSSSFVSNLSSNAQSLCATCSTPATPSCEQLIPACVNGSCVAVNPS